MDNGEMRMEETQQEKFSTLHSQLSIRENAIFVADAHYPHHGDEFLRLLTALEEGRIETPQLFLMGDIFDLLFGCGTYVQNFSSEAVAKLQRLSGKMEIHYLEGNHDFCLKSIFPRINVYSRREQPVRMKMGGKSVALAHGDLYDTGWGYGLYSFLLRQCGFLCLFKRWDRSLSEPHLKRLRGKKICRDFADFEAKAERIAAHYPAEAELIIEGHFHQGRKIGRYLSLPSLACQKELGIVRNGEIEFVALDAVLEEKLKK